MMEREPERGYVLEEAVPVRWLRGGKPTNAKEVLPRGTRLAMLPLYQDDDTHVIYVADAKRHGVVLTEDLRRALPDWRPAGDESEDG